MLKFLKNIDFDTFEITDEIIEDLSSMGVCEVERKIEDGCEVTTLNFCTFPLDGMITITKLKVLDYEESMGSVLEKQLKEAIENENYLEAAEINRLIQNKK
ncbi:hypothetical protein [Leptolyngbya phage Lbo-JY46]